MYLRKTLIITVLLTLLGLPKTYSQEPSIMEFLAECERKYGSDSDLVNGEKYFYPYRQSPGDPFFFSEPRNALISIHEKKFEGQQLRYDIFNQKLVLDYENLYGSTSSLVLRSEWVESFAFDQHYFVKMKGPEGESGFYQQVSEGAVTCIYKWNKDYLLNLASGEQSYYFTDPVKDAYLVIDGQFYPFKNNRTFLRAFEPGQQKTIKAFMKQMRVKVKKASDVQMRQLVEYSNSLSHD